MKYIFIPVKEEYMPSKYIIFKTKFKLGFFWFSLHLVDSRGSINEQTLQMIRQLNPTLSKRYICLLQIGNSSWLWFGTDNEEESKTEYKKVLNMLKEGDNVVFDDFGEPKTRSIRLSWRGLEIEW